MEVILRMMIRVNAMKIKLDTGHVSSIRPRILTKKTSKIIFIKNKFQTFSQLCALSGFLQKTILNDNKTSTYNKSHKFWS